MRFTAPQFTQLCPLTGQPDFAHLVIDYVPGDWLVESTSLKLYLGAFRNHGAFHEGYTIAIARGVGRDDRAGGKRHGEFGGRFDGWLKPGATGLRTKRAFTKSREFLLFSNTNSSIRRAWRKGLVMLCTHT